MLELLNNGSYTDYIDQEFNYTLLDNLFTESNSKKNSSLQSQWGIYEEIYNNYTKAIKTGEYEYIADQIEYNILNSLDTSYRYGIIEKLKKNNLNKSEFVKICTDI
jgi:hypothetical protein